MQTMAVRGGAETTPQPTSANSAGHRQNSAARFVHSTVFLAAYRDRDHVEAATSSNLTIGTGDQDDAVALAPASNMTATNLEVSEIAIPRHRCQRLVHSHTLNIHGWSTSHGHLPGSSVFWPEPAPLTWGVFAESPVTAITYCANVIVLEFA